jgi:hypothetical protein
MTCSAGSRRLEKVGSSQRKMLSAWFDVDARTAASACTEPVQAVTRDDNAYACSSLPFAPPCRREGCRRDTAVSLQPLGRANDRLGQQSRLILPPGLFPAVQPRL